MQKKSLIYFVMRKSWIHDRKSQI